MIQHRFVLLLSLFLCITHQIISNSRDSRFWPWLYKEYPRTKCAQSRFMPYAFFFTGGSAFAQEERDEGIPEMFGKYDQAKVANALAEIGKPTDLYVRFPQLKGTEILWNMEGKLQAQGVGFAWDQQLWKYFSIGGEWSFMHAFSKQQFSLSNEVLVRLSSENDVRELDAIRRHMNDQLGLEGPKWSASGIADIDCYLRIGNVWDYMLKFRRIDAGLKFGFLVPIGVRRNENNPASVPFGANGLFGIYVAADAEFELKEDLRVGLLAQFNQRFAKTMNLRLPIANEQELFGAVVVPARIDPGFSFIFAPYIDFEAIRDGLGVGIRYNLLIHEDDLIRDARAVKEPQLTLGHVNKATSFSSEYISLTIFYDFARVKVTDSFVPTAWFRWDFPVRILASERSAKTNRISLGIEWVY